MKFDVFILNPFINPRIPSMGGAWPFEALGDNGGDVPLFWEGM